VVVSENGIVPLRLPDHTVSVTGTSSFGARSSQARKLFEFGRLVPSDIVKAKSIKSRSFSRLHNPSRTRSMQSSALRTTERNIGAAVEASALNDDYYETKYCIKHSADLKKCVCYLRADDFTLLSGENSGGTTTRRSDATTVSLISAGWLHEFNKLKYELLLKSWEGPKVSHLCVLFTSTLFCNL
jgi:hypothetical protein